MRGWLWWGILVAIGAFPAPAARGYFANGRWSHTATDGATDPLGSPRHPTV